MTHLEAGTSSCPGMDEEVLAASDLDRPESILNIFLESVHPRDGFSGNMGGGAVGRRGEGRTDRSSVWKAAGTDVCSSRRQL